MSASAQPRLAGRQPSVRGRGAPGDDLAGATLPGKPRAEEIVAVSYSDAPQHVVSTSPVIFSPAGPGDAHRIAGLHAESWRRHYRGAYADAYLDGDLLSDRCRVWSARLASPAGTAMIIAERDGQLAGFVHVALDVDPRWGSLVDNLHVRHLGHRAGIGTQLMAYAARAVLAHADSPALHLWVLQQNTGAQAFYLACGGTRVEAGTATAPCGDPTLLNGRPGKYRIAWPDAMRLLGAAPDVGG
jgi:GNAT superfamily N-acetyltransferase